ncbi:MAG: DUF373 family protein [Candidatus Aenigmarchaeota archaeon]|nr:DUF373 family protein [Candidatus Aenigmarchaeota archaeon]
MAKTENLLILNVDRDNDLGEKAKVKGPLIGRHKLLDAALALGVADPEDSDCNAIFQTVKIADDLKSKYTTESAIITGSRNVGIESDREIQKQLTSILKNYKADYVVLVVDGSEDESVIPIIQSKVPILSVKTVIVKQSHNLESSYFKIREFLSNTMEDPKMSKIIFGLPAAALILYALFDYNGWRLILGLLGTYFFIKGFKLEDIVLNAFDEFRESLFRRKISFFTYVVAFLIFGLAAYRGYTEMNNWINVGLFEGVGAFLAASVYVIWLGVSIATIGRILGNRKHKRSGLVYIPMFTFAVAFVIHSASSMLMKLTFPFYDFMLAIIAGFVIAMLALVIEKKWK